MGIIGKEKSISLLPNLFLRFCLNFKFMHNEEFSMEKKRNPKLLKTKVKLDLKN